MATEKEKTRTHARIPEPEREHGRSAGARPPPAERPRPAFRLTMSPSRRLSVADFKSLRPSRRVNGVFFALSTAPRPSGLGWAVIVSKKVASKAVSRNLVKRRCRSVLYSALKNTHAPLALVFHARRGVARASFSDIKRDIESLLERADVRGTMRGT